MENLWRERFLLELYGRRICTNNIEFIYTSSHSCNISFVTSLRVMARYKKDKKTVLYSHLFYPEGNMKSRTNKLASGLH